MEMDSSQSFESLFGLEEYSSQEETPPLSSYSTPTSVAHYSQDSLSWEASTQSILGEMPFYGQQYLGDDLAHMEGIDSLATTNYAGSSGETLNTQPYQYDQAHHYVPPIYDNYTTTATMDYANAVAYNQVANNTARPSVIHSTSDVFQSNYAAPATVYAQSTPVTGMDYHTMVNASMGVYHQPWQPNNSFMANPCFASQAFVPTNHVDQTQQTSQPVCCPPTVSVAPACNNAPPVEDKALCSFDYKLSTTTKKDEPCAPSNKKMSLKDKDLKKTLGKSALVIDKLKPEELSEIEKKLDLKRQRNREAARKCRDKKLNMIKQYERELAKLTEERDFEKSECARLANRRTELRLVLANMCHQRSLEIMAKQMNANNNNNHANQTDANPDSVPSNHGQDDTNHDNHPNGVN